MTKAERAQYLVNLMTIMEGKEAAGRARGTTLVREYEREYATFIEEISDEARKSK